MGQHPSRQFYLEPGYIMVPLRPAMLASTVTSGVVVSLYDRRRRRGGLCHYSHPGRAKQGPSTACYAEPAIHRLAAMLLRGGSTVEALEAHFYGGASDPDSPRFIDGLAEANVRTGLAMLRRLRIALGGQDTGGNRGRRLLFASATGESIVARLEALDAPLWYPPLPAMPTSHSRTTP